MIYVAKTMPSSLAAHLHGYCRKAEADLAPRL